MFHNILVCVDGSVHAGHALDEAIDLATVANARMTILTAIPRPTYWASSPATVPAVEPLSVELERGAKKALEDAVDRVPQSVPVTKILSRKPIREALLEQLQTGQHDLLVMGSRGRGALASSVLGSVSHFALNHNSVPVLIVHSRDEESQRRDEESNRRDEESDTRDEQDRARVTESIG
jgi:nucleotide-binding universal stress UspA family protein